VASCSAFCNDPQVLTFRELTQAAIDNGELYGKNGRLQVSKVKTFVEGLYAEIGEKDRMCYLLNKCGRHLVEAGVDVEGTELSTKLEFLRKFCEPITETRRLGLATMQSFCFDACDPTGTSDCQEPKQDANLVMGDKDATGFCSEYCRTSDDKSHCVVRPNDLVHGKICEVDGSGYPEIRTANKYWCQLHCEHKGELDGTFHVGSKQKEAMCIPKENQPDVPEVDHDLMVDTGFTLEFGCREHCFHKEHDDPSFKGAKCHGNPKSSNLCNMVGLK